MKSLFFCFLFGAVVLAGPRVNDVIFRTVKQLEQ